jgi:hypothetical protein
VTTHPQRVAERVGVEVAGFLASKGISPAEALALGEQVRRFSLREPSRSHLFVCRVVDDTDGARVLVVLPHVPIIGARLLYTITVAAMQERARHWLENRSRQTARAPTDPAKQDAR